MSYGFNFLLLLWPSSFAVSFIDETILSLLNGLGTFVENQLTL